MNPDTLQAISEASTAFDYVQIWFPLGLVCGGLCAYIANDKNRNPFAWFLIGLCVTVFGLIAIAGLTKIEAAVRVDDASATDDSDVRALVKKLQGGSSQ